MGILNLLKKNIINRTSKSITNFSKDAFGNEVSRKNLIARKQNLIFLYYVIKVAMADGKSDQGEANFLASITEIKNKEDGTVFSANEIGSFYKQTSKKQRISLLRSFSENLKHEFLEALVHMAMADGDLDKSESDIIVDLFFDLYPDISQTQVKEKYMSLLNSWQETCDKTIGDTDELGFFTNAQKGAITQVLLALSGVDDHDDSSEVDILLEILNEIDWSLDQHQKYNNENFHLEILPMNEAQKKYLSRAIILIVFADGVLVDDEQMMINVLIPILKLDKEFIDGLIDEMQGSQKIENPQDNNTTYKDESKSQILDDNDISVRIDNSLKLMQDKIDAFEDDEDLNYWYEIVKKDVNYYESVGQNRKMLNLNREQDYLTWLFGHDEEYEEKMGGDSKENKITFIKMRIIAFGAILEFLEEHYNTITSFKGYDSLDTSDQKYPIEEQIGYCRARLYGSIKFALRHQISKEEIKKWYKGFDENEDLYHGLNYTTLYSEEQKKEFIEKLKSPTFNTDRYAPAEVVDKTINDLESSLEKVSLISCDKCGKENVPEAKFCGGCGIKIEEKEEEIKVSLLSCDICGKENIPEAKFCGGCGTKIEEKSEIINSDYIKEDTNINPITEIRQKLEAENKLSYDPIDIIIEELTEKATILVNTIDKLYEEEYTFVKSIREKVKKGILKNDEILDKYILDEYKEYNLKERISKASKFKELTNLIGGFLNELPDPPLLDLEYFDQDHSLAGRCNLLLIDPKYLMSILLRENKE